MFFLHNKQNIGFRGIFRRKMRFMFRGERAPKITGFRIVNSRQQIVLSDNHARGISCQRKSVANATDQGYAAFEAGVSVRKA